MSRSLRRVLRSPAALLRRRRPVTGADAARFLAALRGPYAVSAVRAAADGAVVVSTLERRGLRPLVRDASQLGPGDAAAARQVSHAVDAGLGLLPVKATCLRRSITLMRELQRRGQASVLHIGVRNVRGAVEAHAWVEVQGEVVNDDPGLTRTYVEISAGHAERLLPTFA